MEDKSDIVGHERYLETVERFELVNRTREHIRQRAKALGWRFDSIRWVLEDDDMLRGDIIVNGIAVIDLRCRVGSELD